MQGSLVLVVIMQLKKEILSSTLDLLIDRLCQGVWLTRLECLLMEEGA